MQPKIFGTNQYFDPAYRYPGEYFVELFADNPAYSISNYGRVKSEGIISRNLAGSFVKATRILRPALGKKGYQTIAFATKAAACGQRSYTVQVLMRRAFMPEVIGLTSHSFEVDHIDGDKTNNVLSNLECVTSKENKRRAIRMGLMNNVGEAHGMAKLNEAQAWEVLTEYHLNKLSRKQVADKLGIAEFTVKMIHNGTNWKHVYARFAEQHPEAIATDRAQTRLTPELATQIYQSKERTSILAKQYGMCIDTIKKIRNGKLWASVTGHIRPAKS